MERELAALSLVIAEQRAHIASLKEENGHLSTAVAATKAGQDMLRAEVEGVKQERDDLRRECDALRLERASSFGSARPLVTLMEYDRIVKENREFRHGFEMQGERADKLEKERDAAVTKADEHQSTLGRVCEMLMSAIGTDNMSYCDAPAVLSKVVAERNALRSQGAEQDKGPASYERPCPTVSKWMQTCERCNQEKHHTYLVPDVFAAGGGAVPHVCKWCLRDERDTLRDRVAELEAAVKTMRSNISVVDALSTEHKNCPWHRYSDEEFASLWQDISSSVGWSGYAWINLDPDFRHSLLEVVRRFRANVAGFPHA